MSERCQKCEDSWHAGGPETIWKPLPVAAHHLLHLIRPLRVSGVYVEDCAPASMGGAGCICMVCSDILMQSGSEILMQTSQGYFCDMPGSYTELEWGNGPPLSPWCRRG